MKTFTINYYYEARTLVKVVRNARNPQSIELDKKITQTRLPSYNKS